LLVLSSKLDPEPEIEYTEEELEKFRRGLTEFEAGLFYNQIENPDSDDWLFECNQCGEIADVMVTPFPHKPDCPMKKG
jgi:hypothetical protein